MLSHKVVNTQDLKQNKAKKAVPMFTVDTSQKENNRDIYKIKYSKNTSIFARQTIPWMSETQMH